MWIDRGWPRYQETWQWNEWQFLLIMNFNVDRKGQDWNELCYDSSGWVPIYVNINQLCWSQGILIKRNPGRKLSLLGQDYDLITLKSFDQSSCNVVVRSSPCLNGKRLPLQEILSDFVCLSSQKCCSFFIILHQLRRLDKNWPSW